jgi:hypothetical protein
MNTRRHVFALLAASALLPTATRAQTAFDHQYTGWNALVKKHVKWLPDGKQSRVNYTALATDRAALTEALAAMSALPRATFDRWSKPQQMAFLINAYNAFTVALILTQYPDLKSIKDLGSFIQSPWKKAFFSLLGSERTLDWIEHEQLRPVFKDPRVHAAVNCASIGCPALRDEAFTASQLDAQLDDGMRRFMSDHTRNRVKGDTVEVSAIFKWFKEDFNSGYRGFKQVEDVFAAYAEQLTDQPEEQASLRAKRLSVSYLNYDWSLNDIGR